MLAVLARLTQKMSWLSVPGWLELANDAFYLIGSAVLRSMENY
jgi:hypothetical protein